MRGIWLVGLLGACILFGCTGVQHATDGELADLYLSTLDDKQFVWCTMDLEQCRKDINEWKQTELGRALLSEYKKEQMDKRNNVYEFSHDLETGSTMSTSPTRYGPDLFLKKKKRKRDEIGDELDYREKGTIAHREK